MPSMYCKLFASLYQGTLRGRAHEILVFTNLLAHCDATGMVDKHPRAIAEEVGLTVDQVKEALITLESPDEESRSPELDGARISRIDAHRSWGWLVVNHAKYSAIRNAEDRKEQNRISQQKWRERNGISKVSQRKPKSANKDKDTHQDTVQDQDKNKDEPIQPAAGAVEKVRKDRATLEEMKAFAIELGLPESDGESRFHGLEANGWKAGSNPVKDWKASMRQWKAGGFFPSQKGLTPTAAKLAEKKSEPNFEDPMQALLKANGVI